MSQSSASVDTAMSTPGYPIALHPQILSPMPSIMDVLPDRKHGSGAGSGLPRAVLILAGISTFIAVLVSSMSIWQHLKNYRKPVLQRMVIRIIVMVPIYGISSLIALFSLEAAFVIDAVRDIYEAFVIYCFFHLLLSYLGGERSLLILLHGRPPKVPVFPVNLFKHEIDVSDPHTFLFLKRGILQYVQVKPVLTVATLVLKATGRYNEGDFRANSGYLYVSIVYNASICLSLYCLAMFWVVVNDDLKPFRPIPKFLCVKGILFFSFWQSILVSLLVAAGLIPHLGPYKDAEHISLALTDTLITLEMPLFALSHMYAFAPRDFADPALHYVARMPAYYALRDAFGMKDVLEDSRATLRGEGMDYREFEPSEGYMHQGAGRERRIRAGLRYSKGGKRKYWLPKAVGGRTAPGRVERGVNGAIRRVAPGQEEDVQAPLLGDEADDVLHIAPDLQDDDYDRDWEWHGEVSDREVGYELPFGDLEDFATDEELYEHSKKYLFGDYNYPSIDVSSEAAREAMWDEEERVLGDERGAWASPIRGWKGNDYGAVRTHPYPRDGGGMQEYRNGKGRMMERDERQIDYDQDRTPAGEEIGELKLKWTNVKRKPLSRPTSSSASPRRRKHSDLGMGSPGSSSSPKVRSPPAPSSQRPPLPPDAVDLIVEDPGAAEEERTKERRKGEPALGGAGLRKVYRRGFVAGDSEGGQAAGEVEVEEGQDAAQEGQHIDAYMVGEDEEDEPREMREEDQVLHEAEGIVARAETPPIHARLYDIPDGEDNPWA